MAAVSGDFQGSKGAMRSVHPYYRAPSARPISPYPSSTSLSPTTPTSASMASFKSESTPSLLSSSSLSLSSLASSSTPQLVSPTLPGAPLRRAPESIARTPSSRRKVAGAVYASEFHVSFADLLATIPAKHSDDGESDRSTTPPEVVTPPLKPRARLESLSHHSMPLGPQQNRQAGPGRPPRSSSMTVPLMSSGRQNGEGRLLSSSNVSSPFSFSSSDTTIQTRWRAPPPPIAAPEPSKQTAFYDTANTPSPRLTPPISQVHSSSNDATLGPESLNIARPGPTTPFPSRQEVIQHESTPTSGGLPAKLSSFPSVAIPSQTLTPSSPTKRTVRVQMIDVGTFLLHWEVPEIGRSPDWMASARGYVLDDQSLVVDIHKDTPADERKCLLKLAFECYVPMRQRYLETREILRLSMPDLDLKGLRITPPSPVREMNRRQFKRAGGDPPTRSHSELPRIVLPNPWRNIYRLLHNVSKTEPLWVPTGVVFHLTGSDEDVEGSIILDSATPDEFKSHTMNTMLLHGLRRIAGSDIHPPPDVQRTIRRADLRRLSFHPDKVAISFVGRYGGILDLNLPAPRGGSLVPSWHQPVRVYLTPGPHFLFDYVEATPDWRVDEIQKLAEDHIGVHLKAWNDIRRILGAFAPTDPQLSKLFITPPLLKKGLKRRAFISRVTPSTHSVTPSSSRDVSELPRLHKRGPGKYALEYPPTAEIPTAVLDCSENGEPRVFIHENPKHITLMVAWLFSIVTAIFEPPTNS